MQIAAVSVSGMPACSFKGEIPVHTFNQCICAWAVVQLLTREELWRRLEQVSEVDKSWKKTLSFSGMFSFIKKKAVGVEKSRDLHKIIIRNPTPMKRNLLTAREIHFFLLTSKDSSSSHEAGAHQPPACVAGMVWVQVLGFLIVVPWCWGSWAGELYWWDLLQASCSRGSLAFPSHWLSCALLSQGFTWCEEKEVHGTCLDQRANISMMLFLPLSSAFSSVYGYGYLNLATTFLFLSCSSQK